MKWKAPLVNSILQGTQVQGTQVQGTQVQGTAQIITTAGDYDVPANTTATVVSLLEGTPSGVYTMVLAEHAQLHWFIGIRDLSQPVDLVMDIVIEGEGAQAMVHGLCVLKNQDRLSLTVRQHHRASSSCSTVLIKGVMADQAQVHYRGMIEVDPRARGTVAANHHKSLMLSADARVQSRPQLEVHAQDVSCKHGSAVSSFDESQLLYLCSRGVDHVQAKKLLLEAFCADVLISVSHLKQGECLIIHGRKDC